MSALRRTGRPIDGIALAAFLIAVTMLGANWVVTG